MDNITHTIIGLSIGEAALQWRAKDKLGINSAIRPLYWLSSAVANNLPDLDVPWIRIMANTRLDFLLQHRGYTHSFGALVPFLLINLILCFGFARLQKIEVKKIDWLWLSGLSLLGVFCHLLADSWNSYGVHPFSPWQNRWYYGDSIFILEPWIWVTLLPYLIFSSMARVVRAFFLILFSIILGISWKIPFIPYQISLLLTVVAFLGLTTRILSPMKRFTYCFTLFSIVLFGFTFVSRWTRSELVNRFSAISPDNIQHDLILSPQPANPFCWNYISVETSAEDYILRSGIFAPFSQVFPIEACPSMREGEALAPLQGVGLGLPGELVSLGTFRASLKEFHEMDKNCFFSAFRHFARAPFWLKRGDTIIIGDLRFEQKGRGIGGMVIPAQPTGNCPQNVPNWEMPLAL